jgi:HlyD family secretion protein
MGGNIINLNRVLTVLAILGILGGIYMLVLDQRKAPESQPLTPPSVSPFESFISGAGIVESASENISLGSQVGAVVTAILVKKGQIVKKGTPLFTLDSRLVVADLKLKETQLEVAKTTLEQSKASLKLAEDELALVTALTDKRGVTKEEIITRQDNVIIAQKAVENAEASVVAAQAAVEEARVLVEFYTVRAPIDCEVMQINTHPGEFAAAVQLSNPATIEVTTPLMLLGNVSRYHVRVDIDEDDAWRFNKDEPAVVFLRGNIAYHTDLKFEYFEPYVVPKASFTGDPTERVDTRVLQVIYSYDPKKMPSYLGQEVDVYIKAEKVGPNVRYGGPLPISR